MCNTGYYKSGSSCVLCPEYTIKTAIGNAEDCDADAPCDGVAMVPNENHTDCGTIMCGLNLMRWKYHHIISNLQAMAIL